MRTSIFYFSATGNSLWAARSLAEKLGDAEVLPIAGSEAGRVHVASGRVGIVFPVYAFGMPSIVSRFMDRLPLADAGKYWFVVCTHGGCPGQALEQADGMFKAAGGSCAASFAVRMPGNYTPLYGAESEDRQRKIFEKAEKKVEKIADIINAGGRPGIEKSIFRLAAPVFRIIHKVATPNFAKADAKFWVDKDKCVSCGLCERVCPVANIRMENGGPVWQHHCEQCMACLQWCPREAIQFGKFTARRKRYRHPGAAAADFKR